MEENFVFSFGFCFYLSTTVRRRHLLHFLFYLCIVLWCCSFVYVSVVTLWNCCHNRASSHLWRWAWQRWCEDTVVAVSESNPRVCSCCSSHWRTPERGWPTSTGHRPGNGGRWPAAGRGLTRPRCGSRDTASTSWPPPRPQHPPMVSTGHNVSSQSTVEPLFVLEQLPTKVMCCTFGHWHWPHSRSEWGVMVQVVRSMQLESPLPILIALCSELPPYFYPSSSTWEWVTSPRRITVIFILFWVQSLFLHPITQFPNQ